MQTIKCAIVKDGKIINIIRMVQDDPLIIDWAAVPIPAHIPVSQGWTYQNGQFTEPQARQSPVPEAERQALARFEKAHRQAEAEKHITLLTRAVNRGQATEAQTKRLDAWEDYTIKLDQVDITQQGINWPPRPDNP